MQLKSPHMNDDTHVCLTLQWRHNEHDGVSNHQPHDCLLNCLFGRRSKKTSKLRVTGLFVGNSPRTGEFPSQRGSKAENICIWWRHHEQSGWKYKKKSNFNLCEIISMALCKTTVTSLLTHWDECSLVLSHQYHPIDKKTYWDGVTGQGPFLLKWFNLNTSTDK